VKRVSYTYDVSKKITQRKNIFKARRKASNRTKGINKVEHKLWKILGPSFSYNGNGPRTISGKTPDFICESQKIIVELYGNYWHRNEKIRKTLDRINLYKDAGYKTVIIWEDEVDPIIVKRKLAML
jgi:very-short-patch-repair endonuclease